jgi:hypothetical protein
MTYGLFWNIVEMVICERFYNMGEIVTERM